MRTVITSTKKTKCLRVAAATLVATLGVTTAEPASAAPDPAEVITSASLQDEAEAFVDAITKLEPHVERAHNGTLRIRTTAAAAGVDQHTFNQVSASLRHVNKAVLSGEFTTTADLQILPAGPTILHTGVINRWWGQEFHMSSTLTNQVIGLLSIGAGLAALVGLLSSPTVFGPLGGVVAAAVLVIAAGALTFCNAGGNGVIVNRPWVGPPWCTSH